MRTRPDKITQIRLPSGPVDVDEFGYLTDPALWSREFAEYTAQAEGIMLSDAHWHVIDFMRAYLDEHGVSADQRFVMRDLGAREGLDKATARSRLYELFPYGYVKQACKIAGMHQPLAWSTG